jgi:CBS domain-containing protein
MRIEDVMTRNPSFCGPEATAADAARIMWERDCGFVPVLDAQRIPIGVVTDRDLCMAAYTRGKTLHEIPVRSVMSTHVRTCMRSASVGSVEELMAEAQVRRIPVVDEAGGLVGIVALSDLARGRSRTAKDRVSEHIFADVAKTLVAITRPPVGSSISAE